MKTCIALPFLLLLFACELIVDINVPLEQPKLTLNSFFNTDSLWLVQLNLNRHVLDDGPFLEVNNAEVIIYKDDNPIDTLAMLVSGVYRSENLIPSPGKNYKVTARVQNLESVTSESLIPSPAQIISADVAEAINNSYVDVIVKLKFKDDPTEKNFYQVLLDFEFERLDPGTGEIQAGYTRLRLESSDAAFQNENMYSDGLLVKDILFNGKEVELSFKAPGYSISGTAGILLTLRTVSEDYYNYQTTASLQNNTSGDPFAQPVNVYNNIQNGFGIFAGYSASVFKKSNPKPVITSISPAQGRPGDHIIITGENFDTQYSSVSFKAESYYAGAQGISATENRLEVIVPERAVTGKIAVRSNGRMVISDTDFEVIR